MNLETSKITLVKMILNIDNERLIERITKFISNESTDFWDELSVEEQEEIILGLKQLDNGEHISFEDVLKKIS